MCKIVYVLRWGGGWGSEAIFYVKLINLNLPGEKKGGGGWTHPLPLDPRMRYMYKQCIVLVINIFKKIDI